MARSSEIAQLESIPVLEQVAGKDSGRYFELRSDVLNLGRTDDNDIVLPNESVSRHHAQIERLGDGRVVVRDNKSKNGVQVNGNTVTECELKNGDMVQMGNFLFRFSLPESQEVPAAVVSAPAQPQSVQEFALANGLATARKKRFAPGRVVLYSMLIIVLGYVYYTYNNGDKSQGEKPPEKTDASLKDSGGVSAKTNTDDKGDNQEGVPPKEVPGLEDPALSKAEQEVNKYDWNNSALKQAELYFRKGQREYLNKNYNRAIEAFQTALSLDRNHEMANTYLRLSIAEEDADAKQNFAIAVKYYESLQYERAIYHFKQVIDLMTYRQTDPMVAESEKYIGLCKRRLDAAEMFP
jgi:pSer/pThr/pTyr-binding forkhead associated (FHA) protein